VNYGDSQVNENPNKDLAIVSTSSFGTSAYVRPVSSIIFSDLVAIGYPSLNFSPLKFADHVFSFGEIVLQVMSFSSDPDWA
jgi:hypothetical protein